MGDTDNTHFEGAGFCVHGNTPGDCKSCAKEQPIIPPETKNGLPVMTAVNFQRLFDTDVRVAGDNPSETFDFQGYVRVPDERGEVFIDTLATNGILKSEDQPGIKVSTEGRGTNIPPVELPKDVGEYSMCIRIPSKLQKQNRVVCDYIYESCFTVEDYKKMNPEVTDDEIEHLQELVTAVVARIDFDQHSDPLARKKTEFIHGEIVNFIKAGGALNEIKELIYELEEELRDVKSEDLTEFKRSYR